MNMNEPYLYQMRTGFRFIQNYHLTHALLIVTFQKAYKHGMQT